MRGYTIASEVLGIPVKTEQTETDGKPELVKAFQDATALVDSSGLCLFTTFAWGMDNIAPQIDAACAGDWSVEKCLEVGERVWNRLGEMLPKYYEIRGWNERGELTDETRQRLAL